MVLASEEVFQSNQKFNLASRNHTLKKLSFFSSLVHDHFKKSSVSWILPLIDPLVNSLHRLSELQPELLCSISFEDLTSLPCLTNSFRVRHSNILTTFYLLLNVILVNVLS